MNAMSRLIKIFIPLAFFLLFLPLLGVYLAGFPLDRYFEFPPETLFVPHKSFSWPVFWGLALFVCVLSILLFSPLFRRTASLNNETRPNYRFPWWGWAALCCLFLGWMFAWTRFQWFKALQPHTFGMLWFPFIVFINAVTYKRQGRCYMTHHPGKFMALFPVSAGFWWFFEYLNRFVQNWHYVNVHFGALEYFIFATISFSTVLPAVLSMQELVLTFNRLGGCYEKFVKFKHVNSKLLAWLVLLVACFSLFGIGIWPNVLFPMLWIAPLLVLTSLQNLAHMDHLFAELRYGDWRKIISAAIAAVICGWFWEMWNYWSLAKWEYSIPYVGKFYLFEMPILGYAGYLPFGLECVAVTDFVWSFWQPKG